MTYQRGLSLVELMVTILISSLLLLGVVQLFANTSSSDRTTTALARVQESGRVAFELIGSDARRAGFQGCSPPMTSTTVGAVILPNHAVAVATTPLGITFRYGVTDSSAGTALLTPAGTSRSCSSTPETYYLKSVTYANCGTSICLNGDPILGEAQFTGFQFAIPNGSNTAWKATPTSTELITATAVRVQMRIQDARNGVRRDFTGTYELRNRKL